MEPNNMKILFEYCHGLTVILALLTRLLIQSKIVSHDEVSRVIQETLKKIDTKPEEPTGEINALKTFLKLISN
jgi:hypothetical protein